MSAMTSKSVALVGIGFAAGIACANLPASLAAAPAPAGDLAERKFLVSIAELQQKFVFAEEFSGSYTRTVEMSDGSKRTIALTPMVRDGKQVVEFVDTGFRTYMGLNGTTYNDTLMVQLVDVAGMNAQLREQGWTVPARQ